ncbi:hypothetical protein ACYSTU_20245 [Pseudomonas glycinis]|jgi:hypothetical protein|uniref:hypothetical protein n=1 Tax=Pseudomonas siliginis TaxID=2842346 RepID=UPI0020936B01|nr:hypothetical protein [Pseudomonas siliginis]UST80117.1 hypothetical protein NF676_02005 [Pseudomonas siliginis]
MLNLKRDERSPLSSDESYLVDLYRMMVIDDQKQVMRLACLLAKHPDPTDEQELATPLYPTQLSI